MDFGEVFAPGGDFDELRDGYVATDPDDDGHVEVVTPGFADDLRHGPCPVMPRGSALPKRGDRCLVAFGDDRQPWVVAWDGPVEEDVDWASQADLEAEEAARIAADGVEESARVAADDAIVELVESQSGLFIPKSLVDAKGDLLVGEANDNPVRLAVGANGLVLTADSTAGTGLKWQSPIPAGTIMQTARSTAPTGYVLCEGQAISRTTFSELFTAIGTTYGTGNGSTTFNVPDLRGRVAVGVDGAAGRLSANDALGNSSGAETHTLTVEQIPAHGHTVKVSGADDNNHTGNFDGVADSDATEHKPERNTSSVGGGKAHNNMQPYQVVNHMIKT